ncbi:SWIB-domain-containing protein [Tilletiopsis washingtonensis]|uniref:SWIB-domain-containing protein n=1 Tax=Tilletiopsis washingtonensis TaxID=58919 RepID=A0A316Z1X5_9BASI|nr:SWIB-domain-containing protein [Tilletiopsis washingtonensis]PWN95787.1 SWIB-domain-containing protein [Tilletiopsis washingtonensis]
MATPSCASLRQPILAILRASDLSSISAKKVRTELAAQAHLTRLGLDVSNKAHKAAIDEEIRASFAQLDAENVARGAAPIAPAAPPPAAAAPPRPPGIALPGNGVRGIALPGAGVRGDSSAPPPDNKDAEMAKALQAQFNADAAAGPSTRGAANGSKKRKKTASTSKKDDIISSDEEVGGTPSGSRKKKAASSKKKKTTNGEEKPKNPNNPFNRPVLLSSAMAEICGGDQMPRYEITKQLWKYIKDRKLQNPNNGREIICDERLTALFGKSKVDSFGMAKLVSQHVRKPDEA